MVREATESPLLFLVEKLSLHLPAHDVPVLAERLSERKLAAAQPVARRSVGW